MKLNPDFKGSMCVVMAFISDNDMNQLVIEMQIDNQDNRKLTIQTYLAIKHAKNQKETKLKIYILY